MPRGWMVGTALVVSAHSAFAQDETALALRRETIEQAQAAQNAGRHEDALELAERAGAIRMTPSVRQFIAQEQWTLHRYAASLFSAQLCLRELAAQPGLTNHDVLRTRCERIRNDARAAAGSVMLSLPASVPSGLVVRVAGIERDEAQRVLPIFVDPGDIDVEVTARDGRRFTQRIPVAAGQSARVQVTFSQGPSEPPRTGGSLAGPVAVLSMGGAASLASLAFLLVRNTEASGCTPNGDYLDCPDGAVAQAGERAYGWQTASGVSLGVGFAALTAGGLWLGLRLAAGSSASQQQSARWHLLPTPNGLCVGGAF